MNMCRSNGFLSRALVCSSWPTTTTAATNESSSKQQAKAQWTDKQWNISGGSCSLDPATLLLDFVGLLCIRRRASFIHLLLRVVQQTRPEAGCRSEEQMHQLLLLLVHHLFISLKLLLEFVCQPIAG